MKKNSTNLQDIYRADEQQTEESAPAQTMNEMLEREIRRHFFFNLFAGGFAFLLIGGLIAAFVSQYTLVTKEAAPTEKNTYYVSAYTLPTEEQWAIEYQKAAYQADREKTDGAKAFSTKWVKNAAYHSIMGEQALQLKDPAAAQYHLEIALATFPALTGIHRPLGTAYLQLNQYQKAAEQLQAALEENPSIDVFNNLGVAYFGLGQYDLAEEFMKKALEQQPDLTGCLKNLALLYQKTGRNREAATAFDKYFSLNPRDTPQLQAYVAYLTTEGRTEDVISFLQGIRGADPLAVHLMIAKAAAQGNDPELAVRSLREAARLLTPRQAIAEMHDAAFEKIAGSKSFETLLYQLELASVSLSSSVDEPGKEP